ncbi:hypothetical protein ACFVOR_37340 [Streptomyces sp. NPDC057837]|uniref:hypothetical protein n=1 Tax=Streptomyces sp. NPDC057837 TaxID=3346260 RepID=UPI0036D1E351
MTEQTSAATEATELERSRRYLRPVEALHLSDDAHLVHLAAYQWEPRLKEWVTGTALCGDSVEQGPLPEGTVVTCSGCAGWRPRYERMLSPGYNPEDDDPEVLRRRAEAAENLLKQYVDLAAVTHRYPIMGGHDCLGENHSCSGCALAKQAQEHLEQYR